MAACVAMIKPSEMNVALHSAGLEMKYLKGLSFTMPSDQFSLSDDRSVNYLVTHHTRLNPAVVQHQPPPSNKTAPA